VVLVDEQEYAEDVRNSHSCLEGRSNALRRVSKAMEHARH